ncbi:hypothetical protein DFH06DRAFT_1308153 [Mycena polygramma]|nr:hypothetical protein DFH06DRAFT_1308153 [Mycena polygramma]
MATHPPSPLLCFSSPYQIFGVFVISRRLLSATSTNRGLAQVQFNSGPNDRGLMEISVGFCSRLVSMWIVGGFARAWLVVHQIVPRFLYWTVQTHWILPYGMASIVPCASAVQWLKPEQPTCFHRSRQESQCTYWGCREASGFQLRIRYNSTPRSITGNKPRRGVPKPPEPSIPLNYGWAQAAARRVEPSPSIPVLDLPIGNERAVRTAGERRFSEAAKTTRTCSDLESSGPKIIDASQFRSASPSRLKQPAILSHIDRIDRQMDISSSSHEALGTGSVRVLAWIKGFSVDGAESSR